LIGANLVQAQIDAAHANERATLATLPVCDDNGVILCDVQGVSLALHALYYGHSDLAHAIAARCTRLDLFSAAALNRVAALHSILQANPMRIHDWAGDGFHALGLACFFAAPDTAQLCIASGADVNRASNNHFHVAPIHSAAAADNMRIVQMLLDAGADANLVQHDGFRALHTAAQHGNRAMCALLLAYGADRYAQTSQGLTALDIAAAHQHTQLRNILL
jgi:ankyrin repeat protein